MSARPRRPRRRASRPLALGFQRRPRGVGELGGDRGARLRRWPRGPRGPQGTGRAAAPHAERAQSPGRLAPQSARAGGALPESPLQSPTQAETVFGDEPRVPFPTRLPSRSRSCLSLRGVSRCKRLQIRFPDCPGLGGWPSGPQPGAHLEARPQGPGHPPRPGWAASSTPSSPALPP